MSPKRCVSRPSLKLDVLHLISDIPPAEEPTVAIPRRELAALVSASETIAARCKC